MHFAVKAERSCIAGLWYLSLPKIDLLHIGHIRYLSLPKIEQAKRMGDVLVVTITEDGYMDKGPLRPAFTEALRTETAVP